MAFDFGAFAGGLSKGLQEDPIQKLLKQQMLRQPAPLAPGYEDPSQQMSVAGPADFAAGQAPQRGTFGSLKDLMARLFSQ